MLRAFPLRTAAVVAALLAASRPPAPAQEPSAAVDFARDVRPILEQSCFRCHGAAKQQSGLRLDQRAAALAGSKNGQHAVILPGRGADSPLIQRLLTSDEDERMPFGEEALPAEQIALLQRWIEQGAAWPDDGSTLAKHWSYVRPERPPLPRVSDPAWVRNPIDAFVLARLDQAGLAPAPEAPRAALARRVYLDLLGIPPTVEEMDAFLADARPDAYECLVDRLLASPHYGERQAQLWLDLARYADTNGYEKDERRTQWRYRDWVIDACNRDLPFDRFTIEQLAGDLLPDATVEQRIATGFHRNTLLNEEGGVDPEEFRVAAVVDRTNTTASVWLGATLGCAQCHNHKYDPYTQRDYYRFFAFFNSSADDGKTREPEIDAPTPAEAARIAELQPQIEALRQALAAQTPELAAAYASWRERTQAALPRWTVLVPESVHSDAGASAQVQEDGSVLLGGASPDKDTYTLTAASPLATISLVRVEALADARLPGMGPGRAGNGNFVLSDLVLEADGRPVSLHAVGADFEQQDRPFLAAGIVDSDGASGWAVAPQTGRSHQALLALDAPLRAATLRLRITQGYGGQHTLGRFRISLSADPAPPAPVLAPARERLLALGPYRSLEEEQQLQSTWREQAPELAMERAQLAQLESGLPKPATCMVMAERDEPRVTHVLQKGSFLSPGDAVEPGVPAALGSLPAGAPLNRLSLAQWREAAENPLTARVYVNRVWSQYFGAGLVTTPEDFGSQGEPPSDPQLLDWLASEFQGGGWDMKALHRLVVTSATYRQDSRVSPELLEKDPYNRLYARGPRYRVEAEMVRDIALGASGLMNPAVGGPSVFPPQPDGVWNLPYNGDRWMTADGPERYRRALYTFWRRSAPYPMLVNFDAPSREFACTRRARTNTPLQALNLLNDPAFVEAAQSLARRMLQAGGADAGACASYGFRSCTARAPSAAETAALLELYQAEHARYAADAAAAQALAASPDPALAAWTVVANVLLNLDETLTKS